MKIIDEALLDRFRAAPCCEVCFDRHSRLDPHHIRAKGIGGGGRVDMAINLIAVCRGCHAAIHNGQINRPKLLSIVAERERTTTRAITLAMDRIRRLGKDGREIKRKGTYEPS